MMIVIVNVVFQILLLLQLLSSCKKGNKNKERRPAAGTSQANKVKAASSEGDAKEKEKKEGSKDVLAEQVRSLENQNRD
ncbi:hypothetical protein OSTOST_20723 [Ostertagia ostertagi]